MWKAPTPTKSASTASLIPTMMLLAVVLSRAPRRSSHVIAMTIPNAGTLTRIGMPTIVGADCSRPWTAGSLLSSAVRYPVVSHCGRTRSNPRSSVVK